jgi:hypothetical protein
MSKNIKLTSKTIASLAAKVLNYDTSSLTAKLPSVWLGLYSSKLSTQRNGQRTQKVSINGFTKREIQPCQQGSCRLYFGPIEQRVIKSGRLVATRT